MPDASVIPFGPPSSRDAHCARPPGALDPWSFLDRCTRCGDCAEVCPESAIGIAGDGTPFLIASRACDQCGLCADICMRGAIDLTPRMRGRLDAVLRQERLGPPPDWAHGHPPGPSVPVRRRP